MTTRTGRNDTALVLGFPDYRQPAKRMADRAGLHYADIVIHTFPDGESLVRLPVDLPERVILFGSLDRANRRLVELELAASTALRLGARRLTLVAPYLGYIRQDTALQPGEALSQRIIGDLLARHFDVLITVDPHLHRTKHLKDAVPVRHAVALSAAPIMAAWLRSQANGLLLIGPDEESRQWVKAIAAPGGQEYGVARKRRRGDRDVNIQLPDMAFPGRHVVLVDDVVSTGCTLVETARQLAAEGAAKISVLVTHALFVDDALARLRAVGVGDVCSTDSIQHPTNKLHLDGLLAAALVE
jgi:ribose-phosphate pyrophosphokinase